MPPLDDTEQDQTVGSEAKDERRDCRADHCKKQDSPYVGEEAPLLQRDPGGEDDRREQAVKKGRGREAQRGGEAEQPDDDAGGDAEEHRRCGRR